MVDAASLTTESFPTPRTFDGRDALRQAADEGVLDRCNPRRDNDASVHLRALVRGMGRRGSLSAALSLIVHLTVPFRLIRQFGDVGQQRRWLGPAVRGEMLATALLLSEPENGPRGHRPVSIRSEDDGFVLDGSAPNSMNVPGADFAVVVAPLCDDPSVAVIAIILLDAPDITLASRASDETGLAIGTVSFANSRIPATGVLGQVTAVDSLLARHGHEQRLLFCEAALSCAEGMLDATLDYAIARPLGERSLTDLQVVRHSFADRAADIMIARALLDAVLTANREEAPDASRVSMTELVTFKAATSTVDGCLQVLGGRGFLVEHKILRAFRDALDLHAIFSSRETLAEIIATQDLQ